MKVGLLATMAFALMIGFPIASMAGLASDTDGDGVPDVLDNCDVVANAAPLDCDTNQDGYGNVCDCDLNGSNNCNLQDFNIWRQGFVNQNNPDADHNCSGNVNLQDFNLWRAGFQDPSRLSSGLSCAGTIPCN